MPHTSQHSCSTHFSTPTQHSPLNSRNNIFQHSSSTHLPVLLQHSSHLPSLKAELTYFPALNLHASPITQHTRMCAVWVLGGVCYLSIEKWVNTATHLSTLTFPCSSTQTALTSQHSRSTLSTLLALMTLSPLSTHTTLIPLADTVTQNSHFNTQTTLIPLQPCNTHTPNTHAAHLSTLMQHTPH